MRARRLSLQPASTHYGVAPVRMYVYMLLFRRGNLLTVAAVCAQCNCCTWQGQAWVSGGPESQAGSAVRWDKVPWLRQRPSDAIRMLIRYSQPRCNTHVRACVVMGQHQGCCPGPRLVQGALLEVELHSCTHTVVTSTHNRCEQAQAVYGTVASVGYRSYPGYRCRLLVRRHAASSLGQLLCWRRAAVP